MRTAWTRGRPGDFKMGLQCLGLAIGIEFHGLLNGALNQRHFEWRTCGFSKAVMAQSKSAGQHQQQCSKGGPGPMADCLRCPHHGKHRQKADTIDTDNRRVAGKRCVNGEVTQSEPGKASQERAATPFRQGHHRCDDKGCSPPLGAQS